MAGRAHRLDLYGRKMASEFLRAMNLSDFDFDLPEDRIALRPARPRDSARLLHVGADGALFDRGVLDLPDLLAPGDLLVFNDTRVIPAALEGVRPARAVGGGGSGFSSLPSALLPRLFARSRLASSFLTCSA